MRPCDPSSSATQHTLTAAISCFNSMYFAPRPCARCPPREHQFIARLFRMPRPCSFLHFGMLTDTVRARPASKRRIYRPCARPVSRDRGRSRTFCAPSRRLESAPWPSRRSASCCKPLALGTVAPGPTYLIFESPGRASGERQERIWAVKEVPETPLTSAAYDANHVPSGGIVASRRSKGH